MIVATHLHRAVAQIRHRHLHRIATDIDVNISLSEQVRSRYRLERCLLGETRQFRNRQKGAIQRQREITVFGGDRMVDGDQLGAVGECALHLHVVDHLRHPGHDLIAPQQLASNVHQLRHAASVADQFQQHRGDQCDRLRMIQPESAREPFLREETGVVEDQLVEFPWGEVHGVWRELKWGGGSPSRTNPCGTRDSLPSGRKAVRADAAIPAGPVPPRDPPGGSPILRECGWR